VIAYAPLKTSIESGVAITHKERHINTDIFASILLGVFLAALAMNINKTAKDRMAVTIGNQLPWPIGIPLMNE